MAENLQLLSYKYLEDKPDDEHYWSNQINTPLTNAWCGLAFERVCLAHISQIKQALGISGVASDTCAWACKKDSGKGVHGSQIDLIIARKDQIINLCEMKFSGRKYAVTAKLDEEIGNKTSDFLTVTGTRCAIHPTLVTPYGVTDGSFTGRIQNVITADDLFS